MFAGRVNAFYNVCRHRGTKLCTEAAGSFGRSIQCPYHSWTYDLDVSVSYKVPIPTDLRLKLAVYNVLNQQRVVTVDQDYEPQDSIGTPNPMYGYGTGFQSPRYAQLTVTWNY